MNHYEHILIFLKTVNLHFIADNKRQPIRLKGGRHTTKSIYYIMAKVFTCTLKESRAGMPKGTTIQVTSNFSSPADYQIADECERRFGRKARDAQYPGYWIIK